ncbi:MAG: CHAT domain-containing protein [Actinomycetota bacterium]
MALVPTLAFAGDPAAGLREAERAAPSLRGGALARLRLHEANVFLIQGRLDEALAGYRRALPGLRRAGDRANEADLLNNRAMVCAGRGAHRAAAGDLRRALELYRSFGEDRMAANTLQNLGFVAARQGDLPAALAWFDQADDYFAAHGLVDAVGLRDRCEALIPARLVAEARRAASAAVDQLGREGRASYLAEAQLMLASALLLDGDCTGAQAAADEAAGAFTRQRRSSWLALARLLSVRAAWQGGECSPGLLAAARRAAAALETAGWAIPALDARLIAAQVALGLGRRPAARRELALASAARRRGPAEQRARAWHAEALLRLAGGDRRGADEGLRAGLRILDRYRAALGATELRVHASGHAADLARMGLGLALEDGRPDRVLAWAERWRAGALHLPPARPGDGGDLARDLAELRRVAAEADAAALEGRPTAGLLARVAAAEESVRRRARHARATGVSAADPPPTARQLAAELGPQALVELVEADGDLHAVVLAGGRLRLRPLGPVAPVRLELEALRSALRRLAFGRGSPASLEAAEASAVHSGRRLDRLLLQPVLADVGSRPLVLVPPAELHALPWASLPSCGGRPVVVAPSAALWWRGSTGANRPRAGSRVVLVAGPGLDHAAAEVAALARRHPGAVRLTGRRATVEAVAAALDGAGLVHIAAHGRFRADNPLFSCLQLADGPLTVYDLEGLRRAPRTLVLSACDSGLSAVRPGDEVMGLAAAVFSLGTATLVASVIPVPDDATRRLMLAFHRRLQAGDTPAVALAAVRGGSGADPASAGFVCFGSGR